VTSHVLNEGVDVPEVKVAIIISGTSSAREYIQRLGRILRKQKEQKLAILYEIIAANTREESVSERRSPDKADIYTMQPRPGLKAAEKQVDWGDDFDLS